MTHVRFLLNRNVHPVVDGEPGGGEVSRSQVEAWQAAGVELELIEDTEPATPPKGRRQRDVG